MKQKGRSVFLMIILVALLTNACHMENQETTTRLFVGTYTNNGSEGIYTYSFHHKTGALLEKNLVANIENPSFLAISPNKKNLYAVSEVSNFDGNHGSITSFSIRDTSLVKLNEQSTHGAHPCYVEVSKDGSKVAVANYTGGNLSIYNTTKDGALETSAQIISHKSVDTTLVSHPHKTSFEDNALLVADLGLDVLKIYTENSGQFLPSKQEQLQLATGAGPRHFVSAANKKVVYVINELNATITVFKKNGDKYTEIQTVPTIDKHFTGESYCADIHLSPDGRFLYGSNRGENTLVIFKVDAVSGLLSLVGRESVRGDWPRNFTIDPTGNFILVANQRSNTIAVFKRNLDSGTLSFIDKIVHPSPVCLLFY